MAIEAIGDGTIRKHIWILATDTTTPIITIIIVLTHSGIQHGAVHIVFHTIPTILHTTTDMVLMVHHITIILITSTIIRLHRDTEIQQEFIPGIVMAVENLSTQEALE